MPADEGKAEKNLLPRREKIKSGREIRQIKQAKQKSLKTPLLHLVAREKKEANPRLVIICSKKVGNACQRNQTRRAVEAKYLKNWRKHNKNMDLVINIWHKDAINQIEKAFQVIIND